MSKLINKPKYFGSSLYREFYFHTSTLNSEFFIEPTKTSMYSLDFIRREVLTKHLIHVEGQYNEG